MDDKILEAFKFGTIQDCRNIQLKLEEHNISWDEFTTWVDGAANQQGGRRIPAVPELRLERRCPNCDSWLQLEEVNHHPKLMVGDDLESHWFCRYCPWEEYSKEKIEDEARSYIVEG